MVEKARRNALLLALHNVEFVQGGIEKLPLPDRSVDRVSIAFGLRNCTDKDAVLREARRVRKPAQRLRFVLRKIRQISPRTKNSERKEM